MTAYPALGRYAFALAALLVASAAGAEETVLSLGPEAREQILNEAAARNAGVIGEPAINGIGRQIHGEVGMMIGTHGARGIYTTMDAPLGQTGQISMAFETTRFGH